jgi:FSR family fosmidomycin resistance protein-like MFS transporter
MQSVTAISSSDTKVISLIGLAHFFSHFYQLTLPALFPLMLKVEGLNWAELGTLSATLFVASGISQTPSGFLVDKIGARPMLIGGIFLMSLAMMGFWWADSYPLMLLLAFIAGIGNSVFHPADFSILNGSVDSSRMGRAFSVHHFGGYIGYASAPFLMLALGTEIGWRESVLLVGSLGLAVTILLWVNRPCLRDCGIDKGIRPEPIKNEIKALARPSFVMAFLFFAFMAMGSVGLMTLGAGALIQLIDISSKLANGAISLQLTGTIAGVLVGGFIADRITRHDYMTALVVLIGALLLQLFPAFKLADPYVFIPILVIYGLLYGIAGPMRDMVIRSITPAGAAGKVFGFTYSGMDVGSAISGVIFGYLLQKQLPEFVFIGVGLVMLIGVVIVLAARSMAIKERQKGS